MARGRIVIVGAGMTGLACAWALKSSAREVIVLEASERVGGNVRTEREGGFVMDAGPDGWLVTKPEASALAREAGLAGEFIDTIAENRRVYVAHDCRLHAMPEGVVLGVPTRIAPMVTTRLFSMLGKARMGLEPFVKARTFEGDDDESVGDFVARRLGREAADRLAAPLLGGIFAGDAWRISVRAAFPQLVEQEKKYGSLIRAMRAMRAQRAAKNGAGAASAFASLRSGMATFPEALARALDVRLGARVTSIEKKSSGGFVIAIETRGVASILDADDVIVAAPPHVVAKVLGSIDADAARIAGGITCGSSAAIFVGYRRADVEHPLDASGFVVPRARGPDSSKLVACTFVSSKWEGRAPERHVLFRAFVGGAGRESALEADDDALVSTVRAELAALIGRLGEPVIARVFRHRLASPQPELHHLVRMRELDARLANVPGLHVIGNGYRSTGIPDCIKQARVTAMKI